MVPQSTGAEPAQAGVGFRSLLDTWAERVALCPDVNLPEIPLQLLFELEEPLPVGLRIRHVGKEPHEIVLVDLAFVLPNAADGLRLKRGGTKALPDGDDDPRPPTRPAPGSRR